MAQLFIFPKYR